MSLLVKQARDEIRSAILDAAGRAMADGALPLSPTGDFNVEVPAGRQNGDFSSNAAMAWARDFRKAPRVIAEEIVKNLDLTGTFFDRCEVAGAGFLNFWLSESYYAAVLLDIREKGADYGRSDYGQSKKINVEFISANPTGPMHMGNARGGALGDCLAAVMAFAGYDVSREFYVNDAGNQIEKFALSLDIRYQQIYKGEKAVPLPEDSYHGDDITEHARAFAGEYGDRLLSVSEDERRRALVKFALPKNITQMRANAAKYRIEYDRWFFESELYESGEVAETVGILKQRGLTYEKDGALWYKATEHGCEKDEVLIRSNGLYTYFAADIAYHRNKLEKRGFYKAIDVWGADHHGHVARMKGALDAIGLNGSERLDVILMQLVNLVRDGETVRMSKRTGKSITLTDLLEEIPIDAVRFLFNMREPATQMEFDLGLAVEQSAQNPVYYCQYAHARICSIFKKLGEESVEQRDCTTGELMLLREPEERELIRHLSALTDEIVSAAKKYDPARITRYTLELAALFHKFYNAHRVKCGDEGLMQARMYLCACVRDVIRNILTMLKITVPKSM
ncbi:MAG: arginine--tRNA ligase [Oscillospiraceae bacterium]|nr:arginine--tRNA ligase [Oscillospiraceae bacterium]